MKAGISSENETSGKREWYTRNDSDVGVKTIEVYVAKSYGIQGD